MRWVERGHLCVGVHGASEGDRVSCHRLLPDVLPAGDQVQSTHHLHLDPLPRLVSEARQFVLEHAPDLPDETQDAPSCSPASW